MSLRYQQFLIFLLNLLLAEYIICIKFMQKKIPTLSDIKIVFRPKNISFKKAKNANYRLYLQKNVQVIAAINEMIKVNPKNNVHIFNSQILSISFRVITQKFSTYQLSLYQILQSRQQAFVDSVEFSLQKFLHRYFEEYVAIIQQLKGKEKKTIAEQWRALSNNFTKKLYSSCVKFANADALLQINCLPQTQYDQIVKKDDEYRLQRKTIENSLFKKSKTLPTVKIENEFHQSLQKKYHQHDNDAAYRIKKTSNDQKTKQQVQQELKKFHMKLPQIMKPKEVLLKSNNVADNSIVNSIFKIDEQDQIQYKDLPVLHEAKQQQQNNKQIPKMYIKNFRQIQMPENKSISIKFGNLSLNSIMYTQRQRQRKAQSKSNLTEILLTTICMGAYLFLIIFLMHPIPKV